ncbi:soluble lytic murein transglycosylase [Halanaerobium saccharolyticum]|uniref:Soluble lytic murein transglycosylase n=1 Tax=Halanaerobium saccharolyticum TaxID=43595 RepID=A0A4R7Z9V6_9FIRM|nr:lytic transglycosylase domain-containing protein [Halanaerobium saccharolyticum]RAK10514.1 soluble lytic murein transglycosylase [Halanaerobium saccharolyticum]TDW06729.1 soluble lytic murein transglycosylase [Halanaerobium saccharolyticum]TDX62364.1 soluble lytic murein transglycosylase [Halanaerobium saccharolyticum]
MWKEYIKKGVILLFLSILLLTVNSDFDLWTIRRNIEPVKYQEEINKYAEEFSLEAELLAALIYVESRFDKHTESPKGALGLMQLMPSTAFWIAEKLEHKDFSLEDLDDPELNIKFGSWYFSYLYHKFDNDLIKSIAAYNAGENNVRIWINDGWNGEIEQKLPFEETDDFVRRVISTRDYYQKNTLNIFRLSSFKLLLSNSFE